MAAHNFSLYHCQLMTLLMSWNMLFITLYCHAELQTQTYALCLTGTPSKVLREMQEQDPYLLIMYYHWALLFQK